MRTCWRCWGCTPSTRVVAGGGGAREVLTASPLTASTSPEHLPTALYQDAMDVFCRFIPSKEVLCRVAQELAFTMNISKEDAEYFTTKHKPSLGQEAAGVPTLPTSSLLPLRSVFSIMRHTAVVNVNQQSDSGDLLGGFRPVSLARSLHPVRQRFTEVFCSTFDSVTNSKFLNHLDS